ncbi:flagellar hook-basal body complex protein FliE [Rhizobium paknamense]|uniref:Flagellar hook-basal body complex protein FliE n=1 Tax=Rhizobium paknamense TaxID=1206817 RepID=A0ABU0IFF4_9HYPH|nr:flagellar hook-basal body complex protein FliE [Rhizobium paknamense]MDQ0456985.1 flagellar hook-basal body complex protein FliE [Rhizobium paknamense]
MIDSISKISGLSTSETGSSTATGMTASLGMSSSSGITAENSTPGTTTGLGFGEVLGNMMTTAADSLKAAESASLGGMAGKVSTRQVVDAVMQADQSLQTAIALRDKLVSAYLDITKMQI